ncbi:MAG: TonB dependent receptor [Bacteroidetes bacterium ADurb.Bin302]|nr:MAG: TonB dependent receptor [Bacteroidetes bacterium ADurb.Bin302]
MSEESWLKGTKNVDYLKLRAGWGQIGNDQVDESAFVQSISTPGPYFVGYVLGSNQSTLPGAAVLSQANENGRWETSEQWNVGFDFGFFNNLLTGSLEGYIRDTKDAILSVTAPAHVGNMWAMSANLGTIRNMGLELTLGHQNSAGDFTYGIDANIAFAKNEMMYMNGGSADYGDRTKTDVGLPVRSFWGYNYLGVYRSDDEAAAHLPNSTNAVNAGDAKYEDLNSDGKIDESDCEVIGNPFPWLTGSLNFTAGYYGFDLQIFFQGVYGNQIYNALRERTEGTGQTCTLSTTMSDVFIYYNQDKRDAMTAAGIDWESIMAQYDGNIPNPYGNSNNNSTSSRFIEDGSYLRLKNVTLGYTLPKRITQKAKINRVRFYVTANNLLTLTKYSGYDPEVGGGVDYGNYPQSRTFMFGLNLDF